MVLNYYIKCDVCNSVTRIRLQVGKLNKHPIFVTCGNCKISLKGTVYINDRMRMRLEFENATKVEDKDIKGINENYIIESSGEFPVKKLEKNDGDLPSLPNITPYIDMIMCMGDSFLDFQESTLRLMKTKENWGTFRRIIDLYKNNKKEFFTKEIQKIFPKEIFPCSNELERLRALHNITIINYTIVLRRDIFNEAIKNNLMGQLDIEQVKEFINYLNTKNGFNLSNLQFFSLNLIDKFINKFELLIPAFAYSFLPEGVLNLDDYGSTTSDFESVRDLYLSFYEKISELLLIPIGLNNIYYRKDFQKMPKVQELPSIQSMDNFLEMRNNANKYKFCLDSEKYTSRLQLNINSKIRNAIAHEDIEYNPIEQSIVYIPDIKKKNQKESMYLLDFEKDILMFFKGLLAIDEMIYMLMKVSLSMQGIRYESINKTYSKILKIGRNQICPCGSGKKFKKCCGK